MSLSRLLASVKLKNIINAESTAQDPEVLTELRNPRQSSGSLSSMLFSLPNPGKWSSISENKNNLCSKYFN